MPLPNADFSVFGPANNGARLFEEDQAANSVRLLNAMGTASQIQERDQLNKYRQQEMQQRAQTMQQQQLELQRENAFRARYAELAAADRDMQTPSDGVGLVKPNGGQPQSASAMLAGRASKLFTEGYPEAIDLLKTADDLLAKETTAVKEQRLASKAKLDESLSQLGVVAGAYRGVNSPETKAAADQALMIAFKGNIPPEYQVLTKLPYNTQTAGLIQAIESEAIKGKDANTAAYHDRVAKVQEQLARSREAVNSSVVSVNKERVKYMQERESALKKDSPKMVQAFTDKELGNVKKIILDKLGLKDENELDESSVKAFDAYARFVTSTEKEYRTNHRGVGQNQAVDKVFDPNEIKTLQKKTMGISTKGEFHWYKGGSTPTGATRMPANEADMGDGRWYDLGDGNVGLWGKGKDSKTGETKFGWVKKQPASKEPAPPDTGDQSDQALPPEEKDED